jgi:hypothetical protein
MIKNEYPKLKTLHQFASKHKFISVNGLRWLVYKKKIDECVYRLGKRIYIDEDKFFKLLKKNQEN